MYSFFHLQYHVRKLLSVQVSFRIYAAEITRVHGNRGQMDNEWNDASFCGLSFAGTIRVVGFMGLVFGKWNETFSVGFLLGFFFSPLFSEMIFFLSSDWVFLFLFFIGFEHSFWYKRLQKKEFNLISYFLLHIVLSSCRFLHFWWNSIFPKLLALYNW